LRTNLAAGQAPRDSVSSSALHCDTAGAGRKLARLALTLVLLLQGAAAHAQSPGEAVGGVADALRLRPARPPAADFVERARPDPNSLDYKPLAPADKADHKKSAAELDAIGASLENAKQANARAAARVSIPDSPSRSEARKPMKPKPAN